MREIIPAPSLVSLRKEVDRFLDRIREGDAFDLLSSSDWVPNLDFAERKDTFIVKLEVPGIDPKDIEVLFQDGLLTIRGEKKKETEEKDARMYRAERSYGTFVRTIRLPGAVDDKTVTATFHNGILTVMLPKTAETKAHAIPVRIT